MVTRKLPWKGLEPAQVVIAVARKNTRLEIPPDTDPIIKNIITSVWRAAPEKRYCFLSSLSSLFSLFSLSFSFTFSFLFFSLSFLFLFFSLSSFAFSFAFSFLCLVFWFAFPLSLYVFVSLALLHRMTMAEIVSRLDNYLKNLEEAYSDISSDEEEILGTSYKVTDSGSNSKAGGGDQSRTGYDHFMRSSTEEIEMKELHHAEGSSSSGEEVHDYSDFKTREQETGKGKEKEQRKKKKKKQDEEA